MTPSPCFFHKCFTVNDDEDNGSRKVFTPLSVHDGITTTSTSYEYNHEEGKFDLGLMIKQFFIEIMNPGGGKDGSIGTDDCSSVDADMNPQPSSPSAVLSPLRTAIDFEFDESPTNNDNLYIPSIAMEEVVLPGSELQLRMSQYLKNMGYQVMDLDECVICMEGFDPTNPRIPTFCGCGKNKTFFHLSCLYQWVQKNGDKCPCCRERLSWQELDGTGLNEKTQG